MDYYKETLIEELERNIKSQNLYLEKRNSHLHGAVVIKTIKSKEYIYLVYRKNKKVIYKYIGINNDENLKIINEEKAKYEKFNIALKEAKRIEKKLRKAIDVL